MRLFSSSSLVVNLLSMDLVSSLLSFFSMVSMIEFSKSLTISWLFSDSGSSLSWVVDLMSSIDWSAVSLAEMFDSSTDSVLADLGKL